jgi:gluconolactonase
MRSKVFLFVVFLAFFSTAVFGQGRNANTSPPPDAVTANIPGIVAGGTKIEVVKYGLRGSDGVVGMADGSVILTTNGGVGKIDSDGNLSMIVEDSNRAQGLAVDSKGRIIAAQYSKKISILYPPESAKVLFDSFEGKPFIRPNDLVVDKKGGIYFTDCYEVVRHPPLAINGPDRKPDDLPQAVYYITPAGKLTRVADDIARPNGITLSPDGKTLYVNDWMGEYLLAYDVQPDGTLKNRRNFGKFDLAQQTDKGLVGAGDGLCIDSKSNTYSTTPAGVQVFSAKGEHLGNIVVPIWDNYGIQVAQNCGFGGPGRQYLYVVGSGVVLRIHMLVPGYKGRDK